jgi:hypothetical protein
MDFFPLHLLHTMLRATRLYQGGWQNEAEAERNLNPQP